MVIDSILDLDNMGTVTAIAALYFISLDHLKIPQIPTIDSCCIMYTTSSTSVQ